jgi:hypothetical protein
MAADDEPKALFVLLALAAALWLAGQLLAAPEVNPGGAVDPGVARNGADPR